MNAGTIDVVLLSVCSVRLKAAANGFHLTSICAPMSAYTREIDRTFVHLTVAPRSLRSQPTSSRIFWRMQSTSKRNFDAERGLCHNTGYYWQEADRLCTYIV